MEKQNHSVRIGFVVVFCVFIGTIEIVVVGTLRYRGLLTEEDFPLHMIVLWPILLVAIVPTVFWATSHTTANKWLRRLGAAILLIVVPLMTLRMIFSFLTSQK